MFLFSQSSHNARYQLLDRMFDAFADLWMKMKIQVRTKEELDSQQYRFRPRAFDIKNVIEMDVSTLESSMGNEAFSEWKELASEEVSVEKVTCLYAKTISLNTIIDA